MIPAAFSNVAHRELFRPLEILRFTPDAFYIPARPSRVRVSYVIHICKGGWGLFAVRKAGEGAGL